MFKSRPTTIFVLDQEIFDAIENYWHVGNTANSEPVEDSPSF
jgi:hypothetical protein